MPARKSAPANAPARKAVVATPAATKTVVAVAKPVAKSPAAAPVKAQPATPAKAKPDAPVAKAKPVAKPKLVRDSFTMPKTEYAAIDALKQRAAQLARPAKKSELLRAGIKALSALDDKALLAALQSVPTIKTGRPNKG
jgi:hypothetical protein